VGVGSADVSQVLGTDVLVATGVNVEVGGTEVGAGSCVSAGSVEICAVVVAGAGGLLTHPDTARATAIRAPIKKFT
jgi:hypothetical protein